MKLFSSLRELPQAWLALAVIVTAGMAEGLGIMLFVPLLEIMSNGTAGELPRPFGTVLKLINYLEVPVNTLTLLVLIVTLVLGAIVLSYGQNFLVSRSQQGYTFKARCTLIENLFYANWGYMSRQAHGEIINQIVTESHRAAHALRFELLTISATIQVSIYIVFSSFISLSLVLMAVCFGTLAAFVVYPLHKRSKRFGEDTSKANRKLNFYVIDFLKGAKVIKVTNTESAVITRIRDQMRNLFIASFRSEINLHRVYYIIQALPVVLLAIIIYVSHDLLGLAASSTLVFLLFLARITPRVAQIQQFIQGRTSYIPSYRNYHTMAAESRAAREIAKSGGTMFQSLTNDIVFKDVFFRYPDAKSNVLNGVNLTVKRNQIVALVGKSGAGKSTIIDLLLRLWTPDSGQVQIDGVDLSTLHLTSWRHHIGYVTQDVVIFNDTVRNNLLLANPDASDEDIRNAISLAHFAEVLDELPDGLDTELGEGAVRLSGGQRQRLSLARALVGKPDLLLLDEATSALDNESEQIVQDAVSALSHRTTILIIAHRLSTIRKADAIFVMDQGRITEEGTFNDLIAADGLFAELYKAQSF